MARFWQKLELIAAIASLLAPMPAFCATASSRQTAQQAGHTCCAPQAKLAAPSCCRSDTSPKQAIPPQSNDQAGGTIEHGLPPAQWISPQQPVSSRTYSGIPSPILLPATILRT